MAFECKRLLDRVSTGSRLDVPDTNGEEEKHTPNLIVLECVGTTHDIKVLPRTRAHKRLPDRISESFAQK
jgi:hypothetical protein